ncbi:MAG: multifunctional CCA tRNA nucleotidyl transferase/2'3'-cyclic phosphodiesterase/2'nucleotidase/phosphatase [Pseudomonadales bacterium]|nr:multifunctional CCA tRNA nucleotidyl transferase/2'3'-cyclic phosphodiesterase/2'nucleotidase/phosphatase [Pseudomonadales bacterium]NRA18067.1 hypothetical protein [Oceanospirillaceae bacterium]
MKTYLVGGAVRDKLLKYPVNDRDWVIVGADIEQLLARGYTPVGADFPVFLHPQTKEEHALARTERKSGKGYKGFSFYAAADVTLEQDLSRRDLTINAMAEDSKGNIIDPYHGQRDLEDKVLRHVSPAFSEDPLRVLRVARFAARYAHLGFSIAPQTLTLMQQISASGELAHLTKERVWQELERALMEKSVLVFFQVLSAVNALPILFPTLSQLLNNLQQLSLHQDSDIAQRLATLDSAEKRIAWLFYVSQIHSKNSADNTLALDFAVQLRCPNQTKNLIQHASQAFPILCHWQTSTASDKLSLIRTADLLRNKLRLAPLLEVVTALDSGTRFEHNDYLQQFTALIDNLRNIDHQSLISKGFSGAKLGVEIKRLQLSLCDTQS